MDVRFVHDLRALIERTPFGKRAANGVVGRLVGIFAEPMDEVHGGTVQVTLD